MCPRPCTMAPIRLTHDTGVSLRLGGELHWSCWNRFHQPPSRLQSPPPSLHARTFAASLHMHVGRFLLFLACDVSLGVLIRTGSNAPSICDESKKLKPETHFDAYTHTVGCSVCATSTWRWRRVGKGEGWGVNGDRQGYGAECQERKEYLSHLSPGGFLGSICKYY